MTSTAPTVTPFSRADGEEFKDAERELRNFLDPTLPAVIRLDGRAFHSYCKGLARPFDQQFNDDMDQVAIALAQQIDGVKLAYVQSDEVSLLIQRDHEQQQLMFGGQVQKLVSISAAIATATINALRHGTHTDKVAVFDARAFNLPDDAAVRRYFQWRQGDARVNALSMFASAHFPHKQLHGLGTVERLRMLREKGLNFYGTVSGFRHGRCVIREPQQRQTTVTRPGHKPQVIDFVRMEPLIEVPDFDLECWDEFWF